MKSILEKLGGKKDDKPSTKAKKKPAPKPLEKLDVESIKGRFQNFDKMCDYVAEFPKPGAELLNFIIKDKSLFAKYVCLFKFLKTLVGLCPAQIDTVIENIKSDPECEDTFLTGFKFLVQTNELFKQCKGKLYHDDLVKHALSNRRICSKLILSKEGFEQGLSLLPNYQEVLLEILANDDKIFAKIASSNLEELCEFCKKHEKYTARFVRHASTSAIVFDALRLHAKTSDFVDHFPDEEDSLIGFILADEDRFKKTFGSFTSISEYCEKHPRHLERLLEKACSMPGYVHRDWTSSSIISTHDRNPSHAQLLETMIIAHPETMFEILGSVDEIKELCKHGAFTRLKTAFFAQLYMRPDDFNSILTRTVDCNIFLMSELPKDSMPKEGELYQGRREMYVEQRGCMLHYMILNPNDNIRRGMLDIIVSKEELTKEVLRSAKSRILVEMAKEKNRAWCDGPYLWHRQERLKELIGIAPDQELKLRLYYQLYCEEKSVPDIIKAQYQDSDTMAELKLYIMRCIKAGTMPVDTIKSAHEVVSGLLGSAEEGAPYIAALSDLKICLDYNPAPKVAAQLHKGILSGESSSEARCATPPALPPKLPGRSGSN